MLICQLSDLHVCPPGHTVFQTVDTNAVSERAFKAVAAFDPVPDAIVITGDLTEDGKDEEYRLFRQLLRRHFAGPVYVIPGNHDDRGRLREHLSDMLGSIPDGEYIQYVVEGLPIRLVMLDTLVSGAAHGALCEERLRFLDEALAAEPRRPTMIAMHHPPFMSGIEHMDRIRLVNSEAFAAVVARHPHVERIICGHHHRPVFTRVAGAVASIGPPIAQPIDLDLRPRVNGALVLEPPAFHVHRWTPDSGFVTHHAYVDSHPGPYSLVDCPSPPGPE
ncbi:MAG: phosphodiesterase [Acetobacteraceae bacterium]|nr:phosphodiesterase [Acetobacteraceae bacterium]